MANFDITKTQKNPGKIFYGVSIPAANAFMTITNGAPDPTQNPNAKLVGLTNNGSTCMISKSFVEEFFDEFKQALEMTTDQIGMMIKAEAAEIMDFDLLEQATAGVGTKVTATGKVGALTIGEAPLVYSGWCVIFPLKSDPTKYGVFHIYKGFNRTNVEFQISRQTRSALPLEVAGVGIPSRASVDQMGAVWAQQ